MQRNTTLGPFSVPVPGKKGEACKRFMQFAKVKKQLEHKATSRDLNSSMEETKSEDESESEDGQEVHPEIRVISNSNSNYNTDSLHENSG